MILDFINKFLKFVSNLWHGFKYRKEYRKNTIDVLKAKDKDLEKFGRTTYAHKRTEGGAVLVKSSMMAIRNKKNGSVVMFQGTIDSAKAMFNKDYEIVEPAIKEAQEGEIKL